MTPSRALLALALLTASGRAADHRVSNPAEIAAAAKKAAPGDTLIMANSAWTDAKIVFEAEGLEGRPITLRAETPGQVTLSGQSVLRFSGKYLVVDGLRFEGCNGPEDVCEFRTKSDRHATFSRLTNCTFIDCNPPDAKTTTRWVSIYGSDNRVDHCYLAGKTNQGTTLVVWLEKEPVRQRIDRNHFGPRPRLKVNGGETIRVGDSATSQVPARCIVEENLFEGCSGEVEIVSNKSCENVYRHNTFRRCEGALTMRHGHACTVEGNFFFGEGQPNTGGVRVIDAGHRVLNNYFADLGGEKTRAALCLMNGIVNSKPNGYFQVRNAVIAFNTFVNCRETFVLGFANEGGTLPPEDSVFANNLVSSPHGPLARIDTPLRRCTWPGNLFFGAASGLPADLTLLEADPKLAQDSTGLWRPSEGSPTLAAATGDFSWLTGDLDGQPRGAKKDIGADQRSDAPMPHRPLTAADAGPAWRPKSSAP